MWKKEFDVSGKKGEGNLRERERERGDLRVETDHVNMAGGMSLKKNTGEDFFLV